MSIKNIKNKQGLYTSGAGINDLTDNSPINTMPIGYYDPTAIPHYDFSKKDHYNLADATIYDGAVYDGDGKKIWVDDSTNKGGMFSDMSAENAIGLANLGVDGFNAWNMYSLGNKQIDLANKQFDYSKMLGEANYANNAQLTNNQIQNANEVGLALSQGRLSDEQVAQRRAQTEASKVATTLGAIPIKTV